MRIILAGATNGKLTELYKQVVELTEKLDPPPSCVLSPGSFGVWPDPAKIDRTTKFYGGVDYPRAVYEGWLLPIQMVFVAGVAEDHYAIEYRRSKGILDVLPRVTCLANGYRTRIGGSDYGSLGVVGLGKAFSPKTYKGERNRRSRRHYTRAEVERACSQGPTDVLLIHEPPTRLEIDDRVYEAQGISSIIYATRPKLIIHGKCNHSMLYEVGGTPVVSLADGEVQVWDFNDGTFERSVNI